MRIDSQIYVSKNQRETKIRNRILVIGLLNSHFKNCNFPRDKFGKYPTAILKSSQRTNVTFPYFNTQPHPQDFCPYIYRTKWSFRSRTGSKCENTGNKLSHNSCHIEKKNSLRIMLQFEIELLYRSSNASCGYVHYK